MASSSNRYCTRIRADATARRQVLASGLLLAVAGSLVLFVLPILWQARALIELAWWSGCGIELWRVWRRYRGLAGFRLYADGSVDIEAPDGSLSGGDLAAGTVVLTHIAWFRCRRTDGSLCAEPIARNSQERDDWRRFRVICRHVTAC